MIKINQNRCIGCSKCIDICPGNLLTMKDSHADIRDVRDCWGCCACMKICPKNAIAYMLSADLGGTGAKLFVEDSKENLTWQIFKPDGEKIVINVSKNQANKF